MKEGKKLSIRKDVLSYIAIFLIGLGIGLLSGIGAGFLISSADTSSQSDTDDTSEVVEVSEEEMQSRLAESTGYSIDLTETGATLVNDAEYTESMLKCTSDIFNYLRENNACISAQVAESSWDVYFYNKDDEVYLESSSNGLYGVYLNNGKTLALNFDGTIGALDDMDILTLIQEILGRANDASSKHYMYDTSEYYSGEIAAYEGVVEINGWNQIYDIYSSVSKDYADRVVRTMMGSITGDCSLELFYGMDEENNMSFQLLVIAENPNSEEGYDTYTTWTINGYTLIDDWSLDSAWYDAVDQEGYDYTDLHETLTSELSELYNTATAEYEESLEEDYGEGSDADESADGTDESADGTYESAE